MRWIAVALCAGALIAGIMSASEATQVLRGRVVDTLAPGTVLVAQAAGAGMPAMSMPFLLAPQTLSKLHAGIEIEAVIDARTSPATLSAVRIVTAPAPAARYVPELHEGDTPPNFALVDQRGRSLSLARFHGEAVVLSFVYTRCRDVTMCPLVSAKFARLQRMLAREPIHLLEVTLDPAYDTPATLARYGAAFGADATRWTLATGRASDVADLAARAGIVTTETPRGIIHSEAVLILDPNGRLVQVVGGNRWTADDLLAQARAGLGTAPNAVERTWLWLESGVAAVCGGNSGISTATALAIFIVILIFASILLRRLLRAGAS